ncbi:reverse transcriptase-like protein [Plakobranchus ocellatus]|uniref:Reverse transcriptase-like protein n=1 Tax=Plakobranchus ocellatus TaxID=259542 RepID=A0AAV4AJH9_9GAST|nr:reverse transcriptase-like protein [Plakobranchus ocellatus]
MHRKPQTWDKMIPAVLFAYREIPNVTTGYPPFMLMYGRRVRGPADMIADQYIGQQNTLKEAAFVHECTRNLQREKQTRVKLPLRLRRINCKVTEKPSLTIEGIENSPKETKS